MELFSPSLSQFLSHKGRRETVEAELRDSEMLFISS